MLGRRSAQAGLFDAQNLIGREAVSKIPFYGDLAASWREIFTDDHFASLYAENKGRASCPPSIVATATLLQVHEGISDQEVVERTKYDLRWKAVFDTDPCSLAPLFAKSTFQAFRLRLIVNEEQGLLFQAALDEAKRRGCLPKRLQAALDSSPVLGRGAVKDALNLISDAIGKVVRKVAEVQDQEARVLAAELSLGRHLSRGSVKGSRLVDWDDEESKREFLAELVSDSKRVVSAAKAAGVAGGEVELLAKVLAENVEEGDEGPQIPKKVPRGRTTSVHDPDMRHGRKSGGKLYTGHKVHVSTDTESRLLTAVEIDEPSSPEGEHVESLIAQTEARTGAVVEEALGDCAYSTRVAQEEAGGRPLVTKMPAPPKGKLGPADFTVSDDRSAAICPAGHESTKVYRNKDARVHKWPEELCGKCSLKDRCLYAESKRRTLTVTVDFHERRERESYARSAEGREKLRMRVVVEHVIGHLKNLGAGQARYAGRAKALFQWFVAGAVYNLRQVFKAAPVVAQVLLFAVLPVLLFAAPVHAAGASGDPTAVGTSNHDLDVPSAEKGRLQSKATALGSAADAPPPKALHARPRPGSSCCSSPRRRWLLSATRRGPRAPPISERDLDPQPSTALSLRQPGRRRGAGVRLPDAQRSTPTLSGSAPPSTDLAISPVRVPPLHWRKRRGARTSRGSQREGSPALTRREAESRALCAMGASCDAPR